MVFNFTKGSFVYVTVATCGIFCIVYEEPVKQHFADSYILRHWMRNEIIEELHSH